ncbi:hypothetical protein [Kitasatospora sp. NPDC004272]
MLRPVAVLWSVLLAALLALLPCAASTASARTPGAPSPGQGSPGASAHPAPAPVAGPSSGTVRTAAAHPDTRSGRTAPSHHQPVAADAAGADAGSTDPAGSDPAGPNAAGTSGAEFILCTAEAPGPVPGHGCSNHPFCGPDSQLPNAPPQPGTAVRPLLVAPPLTPAASVGGVPTGSHHAPDLHVLQVHRS